MIADDGRIVWMHLEGRTVERDDDGRPRRLQGIMMDVTDRKEREEHEREMAARPAIARRTDAGGRLDLWRGGSDQLAADTTSRHR